MQIFVKNVINLAETHYCVFQIQVIAIFITTFRKSNKCHSFYQFLCLAVTVMKVIACSWRCYSNEKKFEFKI